jgi:hypothetical protein
VSGQLTESREAARAALEAKREGAAATEGAINRIKGALMR